MKLNEYKSGDAIEVRITNPRREDAIEWREGEVIGVQTIYPNNGEKHKPYPMVVVKLTRTYVKANPEYRYLKGNVKRMKVFVDNSIEFYEKESTEGIIHENQIRLKS